MKHLFLTITALSIFMAGAIKVYASTSADQLAFDSIQELNYEALKEALEQGADPNHQQLLLRAVRISARYWTSEDFRRNHNPPRIMTLLMEHGANPNNPDYNCLMAVAAMWDMAEVVQALAEGGAEVNCMPSGTDGTPLWHAASNNFLEVATVLLEHGADPSIPLTTRGGVRAPRTITPLQVAEEKGHSEMIALIRSAR
ncbi:MAG: ankyrin repeat domain-containing protein [Wenzhouxiangella sp.]